MMTWKKIITGFSAFSLLLMSPVAQAEEKHPLVQTENIYSFLLENHLSRPKPFQLVKGALNGISAEAAKSKNLTLFSSPEDDTLEELELRMEKWHTESSVDWDQLNEWAITGMISTLEDPYTNYFSREQLNGFQSAVENEFVGFGLRFRIVKGNFVVKEIIANSPASKVDLAVGDYVFTADGTKLAGKSLEDVYRLLKGEEGTESVFSVYRPSTKKAYEVRLKREVLALPEVASSRFKDQVGYLSLSTFGSQAGVQFRDELNKLMNSKQPLQGLIIDLRDNSGGYLSAAHDIASLFIEDGLLMYTVDRSGIEIETWVHNGRTVSFPVRILVNGQTASASELLAGGMRDNGVAQLVGTKTFGKGVAQQIIPLESGDALKITLQEYFTPKHSKVNHVGLLPNIVVEDEISQIIEALRSLGVNQFEIRENKEEGIWVNGVEFFSSTEVLKKTPQGIQIRKEVLASLLGQRNLQGETYVPLSNYSKQGVHVKSAVNDIILNYQAK